jgi:hypothetical protein
VSAERALIRHGWHVPAWAFAASVEKQYALGLEHGYPLCCVEAFCRDVAAGRAPGLERGRRPGLAYVPCAECLEALQ